MIHQLTALLPTPLPVSLGPFSLGITLAVLVRTRKHLTDVVLSLKNHDYGDYEVAMLLSVLVFAASSMVGMILSLDLSLPAALVLGLYLVIDALIRDNQVRTLTLSDGIATATVQGILAPRASVFSIMLPLLLARDVRWKQALTFSLILSLTYLLGNFIHPSLDVTTVLGFFVGLVFLAVYYEVEKIPRKWIKTIYGFALVTGSLISLYID